jgi:histidine triad (HIT) family protein
MKAMAECLFCRIAAGDVAAHIVYEDDRCLAFLDHRPLFPGHVLLIPRQHYETLADLPSAEIAPFFGAARTLSRAVEEALQADGTLVAINNRVSQSVPHLHVHVVPRKRKDGLRGFFWPRRPYRDDAEAEAVRATIRDAVERNALSPQRHRGTET